MTTTPTPHVSGTIKALEWSQGTRKDDRKAHCECGIFSVGSDDNGGYFAILRHIDADQQCADIQIGWAETRELAMDDCEYERRARILAEIQPDPQPIRYDSNCPDCKGSGERDSGGTHPWGAPAMLPCDCDQPDQQPIPDRVPPSLSLFSGDVELTATTDQPGPVCGLEAPAPDPQPVASEPVACSADHLDMATPECPVCGAFQEATPSSAPASVAEAARALLADSDAVLRLARAYDREDSAQRGETDPHGDEFQGEDGFESFQADRIACAQAALRALSEESK